MRPNLPFLLATSNATLKPGGLLRWKKRLVKDARLSLPLTQVMKIARLTSPLLNAPRQSSPKPRLRHGRRLALLSHLNLTLNLYTLSFALSLAPFSSSSSPNFPSCSSKRESASVYAAYLRSHFSISQPKALRSRARGYLCEVRRATCLEESHLFVCSPLSFAEFLAAASNLSLSSATGPDKVAYPMLNHLPRSDMIFFFASSMSLGLRIPFLPSGRHLPLFPFTRWKNLSTLLLPSGLSLSPHAYQSCLNASFYPVYSSFWSQIPFFLPAKLVSALDDLHLIKFCTFISLFRMGLTNPGRALDDPLYYRFLQSF